jgi:hypothetical protein
MTSPSHAEILEKINRRLTDDPVLISMLQRRIFNHVPQDTPLPVLRFRWDQVGEFDTKDSAGWDGNIQIDVWTDYRGDREQAIILDRLDEILHLQPFVMSSGQSLLLRHDFVNNFTEPDGITHHATIRYRHVATS